MATEAIEEGRDTTPGPIRVLLVGPHSTDVALLRALLEHSRETQVALSHAMNLQHAFETLERDEVDVLLMDIGAGSPRELVAVSQARVRAPLVPVVVLVDGDDEMLAVKAVEVGARGYLIRCALSPVRWSGVSSTRSATSACSSN